MSKIAEYKGAFIIEETLRQRLMQNPSDYNNFNFLLFLPSEEIEKLLGYEFGNGLHQEFRNGSPNVLNLFLWQYLFVQICNEIAEYIDDNTNNSNSSVSKKILLNKDYEELLKLMKFWPSNNLGSMSKEEVLKKIWISCIYYDAPEEEMNYWIETVIKNYSTINYKKVIFEMHLMMFLNPYFLLKQ